MDMTPLLHKPVIYGGGFAQSAFLVFVVVHFIVAGIAPVAGVVAALATKGMKHHLRGGKIFLRSIVASAVTGIVVDVVRLTTFVPENHQKLPGFGMPSSYPARIAFLYAGFCILYLAYEATNRSVFRRERVPLSALAYFAPIMLLVVGTSCSLLIFIRLNPWTGSLWMIWTFMAAVATSASLRRRQADDVAAGVARHRFAMLFLFAFSLWGALQGFGPAIGIALQGIRESATLYTGDQPGAFSPRFVLFLVGWAPPFLLGGFLLRRFARRRAQRATAP